MGNCKSRGAIIALAWNLKSVPDFKNSCLYSADDFNQLFDSLSLLPVEENKIYHYTLARVLLEMNDFSSGVIDKFAFDMDTCRIMRAYLDKIVAPNEGITMLIAKIDVCISIDSCLIWVHKIPVF